MVRDSYGPCVMKMASRQMRYARFMGSKVFVDIKWSGRTQVGTLVEETKDKIILLSDLTHSEISKDSIARLTTQMRYKHGEGKT